ncbi:MAG: hypothetical protein R3B53_02770 [Candidatus Paceibacterota bacterium]
MRRLKFLIGSTALYALPVAMVFAQGGLADNGSGGPFGDLLKNILIFTNSVLIPFIIGIGFLVFVWGMFQFFIVGGSNDEAKEKGKSLMIYATLAFVIIIVFWGVVNFLVNTTGLKDPSIEGTLPQVKITP